MPRLPVATVSEITIHDGNQIPESLIGTRLRLGQPHLRINQRVYFRGRILGEAGDNLFRLRLRFL